MTKPIMYSIMAVLGTIAIGSSTAFGIYFNKNKINQTSLDNMTANHRFVYITMIPDGDVTHQINKMYDLQPEDKTLEDLMKHHSADFTIQNDPSFGSFIKGVFGKQADTSQEYWALTSHSYVLHHPSALDTSGSYANADSLTTGISGVKLNYNEYFKLILTHF